MRFNGILFLSLLISSIAQAQNVNISLFDDEQPLLGSGAKPLEQLHLTPPPLPDVTIDLTQPEPVVPSEPEQLAQETTPSSVINLPDQTTHVVNGASANPSNIPLHNVHGFDVHGFYLGMSVEETLEQAEQAGYTLKLKQEDVPRFYASDYANRCQKQGVYVPQDLRSCIRNFARAERQSYISQIDMTRGKNEAISLFFTSHNTSNELYKIIYYNYGDSSLNFTTINTQKKLQRQREFWAAIYNTYGHPDDAQNMIWGDPQKAFMKVQMFGTAYNAMIALVDIRAYAYDYFAAEDIEKERPPKNEFAFSY
ncbi:MAG: hypothetical protein J6Y85_01040 [Alphaproteobacteria bacterium]|nr:hypothetical protein [Alphaproteobacteria bacterium]